MDCQLPRIVGISLAGKKDSGADVVPAEFCMVEPGQLFRHKIPESATAQMVKFATMRPQERLDKIKRGVSIFLQFTLCDYLIHTINRLPIIIPQNISENPGWLLIQSIWLSRPLFFLPRSFSTAGKT